MTQSDHISRTSDFYPIPTNVTVTHPYFSSFVRLYITQHNVGFEFRYIYSEFTTSAEVYDSKSNCQKMINLFCRAKHDFGLRWHMQAISPFYS